METTISLGSSIIASTLTYPVDIIKTKYQTTNNQSIPSIIKNIYSKGGYRGFLRGLSPHLTTYPIFWGVFFNVKKRGSISLFNKDHVYKNKMVNSLYASGVASLVANPLFVIKTRVQTETAKRCYTDIVGNMFRKEGIRSFYKGMSATLSNNTKLCGQMPLYDFLRVKTDSSVIASLSAKLTCSSIFYPFDLVRTTQRVSINKLSMGEAFRNVYIGGGIRGLYKGVILYSCLTGPNFMLMMYFKDMFTTVLNGRNKI